MNHRLSAGLLIEHDEHLLMVRHVLPGRYDFWVAPGGGVQGLESLTQAAEREVREETGLTAVAGPLAYIEEFHQPGLRHCKFWFIGRVTGGQLSADAPEARAEHIREAAWLPREALATSTCFPLLLRSDYWTDRAQGWAAPRLLPLRAMDFW